LRKEQYSWNVIALGEEVSPGLSTARRGPLLTKKRVKNTIVRRTFMEGDLTPWRY
jgi:hypothetical protein